MRSDTPLCYPVGEAPARHCALFPDIPLLSFAPARRSLCLFAGEFMARFATGMPRHRTGRNVARAGMRP